MLRTLLTWHAVTTAAMLAVYVLVVALQWAAPRLSGLTARSRRRSAAVPAAVVPAARRADEGSTTSAALTGAA